jgi:outer membrane protein OmpA-like peptidoglycan-associated protein
LFESTNKLVFLKNIGLQGNINAGYNFTPVYALRSGLQFNHYNYATKTTLGVENNRPVNSQSLNLDLLVNLTNLNKGYDPDRRMFLSVFGGLGLGYYNANTNTSKIGGAIRAGIQGDYNLTRLLALNLIVDGNLLTDNSNNAVDALPIDIAGGISAGVTYRIPERIKSKVIVPEFTPVPEPKVEPQTVTPEVIPVVPVQPEKPQVAVVDTPKQVKPEVKPEVTKPVVKPEPIAAVPATKEDIFFKFNSRVVETASQEENMSRMADYLKKNPTAKIVVSGYADKASGTDAINNEVSKQRAVNVANTLINKYGVDANRLMVKWYGSKVQPFTETWKNRVVILNTAEGDQAKDFKPFSDGISAIVNEAATKVEINFATENAQVVNEKQREALNRIVRYLKANPQAKVLVKGYASNSSGTDDYNDGISKKRAVVVANMLVKEYGIELNRLKVSWFGARVQPYRVAAMNQLVIVNAE